MGDPNEPSDREHLIRIAEVFGPTLQGEGPAQGRPAVFVRTSGCNLACRWCDTPYTWDWHGRNGVAYDFNTESAKMLVTDVAADVVQRAGQTCNLVVVTGGEPMLQRHAVDHLAALLRPMEVHIETNGTLFPYSDTAGHIDLFVVSPKLAHSGDPANRRLNQESLRGYDATGRAVCKIVMSGPGDIDQVRAIASWMPRTPVWLMPEGRSPEAIRNGLRELAPVAIEHGWHLSGRLHVDVWGDARGH